MPANGGFIGCLAADPPVLAPEVVANEPSGEVLGHALGRLVGMCLGRALFDQAVHPLDHAVGLGRVRLGAPVLNALLLAELVERVSTRGLGRPIAVLEAFERELAPVVGEYLLDLEREERQALRRRSRRRSRDSPLHR